MNQYEEYTDCEIIWLNAIPSSWSVKKLKYVASSNDEILSESTSNDYEFRYVDIGSVSLQDGIESYQNCEYGSAPSRARRIVRKGDVIISTVRTYLKAIAKVQDDNNVIVSTGFTVVRPQLIDAGFLSYFLSSHYFVETVSSKSVGISYPAINAGELMSIPILLPANNEQKNIAVYLDRKTAQIDRLITDKENLIELLKEERQSIISEAVTKGLDPSVPMKDSGVEWLGEIPAHWTASPAKALFTQSKETVRYGDEQLTASQKHGILAQQDYMERENSKIVLADKGLESWKHVEPNDFIISLRSFQGGIEISYVSGCITWHYIVLKTQEGVYPDYFKWLFKSPRYIQALQRTANFIRDGQDLRFTNFIQVPLPTLSLDEQRDIAVHLNTKTTKIDEVISIAQTQITLLKEYRQAVISEAVTGKYIVPALDIAIEEKAAKPANLHFKRGVLAAKILDELCDEPTLGHVKMEKLLFLSEYCGQLDLHTQYDRHAAGPYNPKVLRSIDSQLKRSKWFSYSPSSDKSNKYTRMADSQKYAPYYESYFDVEQRSTIDKLLRLFKTARTIQCEIVATLYGAWNDFLLEGKVPTDAQIINEVLSNWHETKERISYERWQDALNWMKANDISPVGYGKSTKGDAL